MKNKYTYLIWLIALIPVMILRDFTPNNELRYLSIVDEALQNGNIFTFTNQGEIYADKPPLYFWLMMFGKVILGEHRIWYYSLLSLIPALIIIQTMSRWIKEEYYNNKNINSRNQYSTAPLMLMSTGYFIGVVLVVRMDMLMNMLIVLSLYTFYKIYKGEFSKRNSWLFPIYVFLALFTKGPLGLLIPLISTILFLIDQRKMQDFKKYWGWRSFTIIIVGCIIWFAGVYIEGGSAYLSNLIVHQTVGRGIDSFHHKEPFYYYVLSIWYTLAPWSLLVIGVLIFSLITKKINDNLEKYFVIIIISTFIMLSLISSKLAIYSLPIIPFLLYLTVMLLDKLDLNNQYIKLSIAFPAIVFILTLPTILYLSDREEMKFLNFWFIYGGAAILLITGVYVLYLLYIKHVINKSINALSSGIIFTIFIVGLYMPKFNDYIGWGNICDKALELSEQYKITDYWVYNIKRSENMDVYLGKDIIKINREDILNNSQQNRLVILSNQDIENDLYINSILLHKEKYKIGNHTVAVL